MCRSFLLSCWLPAALVPVRQALVAGTEFVQAPGSLVNSFSANNEESIPPADQPGAYREFDYAHHGEDWLAGQCASREAQSPIDFNVNEAPYSCNPVRVGWSWIVNPVNCFRTYQGVAYFDYQKVDPPFQLRNTGFALAIDLSSHGYGGMTFNGMWHNVLSINLHTESEHTFQGQRLPLELHIVHKSEDSDALLIVAVLFDVPASPMAHHGRLGAPKAWDPGFNQALQNLLPNGALPTAGSFADVRPIAPIDLLNPLVEDSVFFEYKGSLTVPPCTERVTWLVRRAPLHASLSQVKYLRKAIVKATHGYANWRAAMPIMHRNIFVRIAKKGTPPPEASAPKPNVTHSQIAEFYGLNSAKEAAGWAQSAAGIAKQIAQIIGVHTPPELGSPSAPTYMAPGFGAAPGPAPGPGPAGSPSSLFVSTLPPAAPWPPDASDEVGHVLQSPPGFSTTPLIRTTTMVMTTTNLVNTPPFGGGTTPQLRSLPTGLPHFLGKWDAAVNKNYATQAMATTTFGSTTPMPFGTTTMFGFGSTLAGQTTPSFTTTPAVTTLRSTPAPIMALVDGSSRFRGVEPDPPALQPLTYMSQLGASEMDKSLFYADAAAKLLGTQTLETQ